MEDNTLSGERKKDHEEGYVIPNLPVDPPPVNDRRLSLARSPHRIQLPPNVSIAAASGVKLTERRIHGRRP